MKKKPDLMRCIVCGKKTAVCSVVHATNGKRKDGRKYAMIKALYNCTECFAETRRGVFFIETFRQAKNESRVLTMPKGLK